MKTKLSMMHRLAAVASLLLVAGIVYATTIIAPLRSEGGVQSTPQASWGGKSGTTGYYIKPDAGMVYHAPNNIETTLGAGGGGGGGSVAQGSITSLFPVISLVDLADAHRAQVGDDAASYSYGDLFVPVRAGLVVTGTRFFWPGGHGALTIKTTLWTFAGSSMASSNVSVNAAGVYAATFGSPQALTAWTPYFVSTWETSGAHAVKLVDVPTATGGVMAEADTTLTIQWPGYYRKYSYYHAGDGAPSAGDVTEILGLVEPTFQ